MNNQSSPQERSTFRKTFVNGMALAVPLGIVLFIFGKLVGYVANVIHPLADRLGISHVLGRLTLTILAILLILALVLVLGMLMRFALIASIRDWMEDMILKIIPSLRHLKMLASETADFGNAQNKWIPAFIFIEDRYTPGYVVEQNDELVTFFALANGDWGEGEIVVTSKENLKILPVDAFELNASTRLFGKGYLKMIDKANMGSRKE